MALTEISDIERRIRESFNVKDVYYKGSNSAEFSLLPGDSYQERFADLVAYLRPKGYIPLLRSTPAGLVVYVESTKGIPRRQPYLPFFLFCVTVGTIAVDGWLKASALAGAISVSGVMRDTALYVGFMLAFLLVPFGVHYIISRRKGTRPPMPYFIPGLPPNVPTFGALYAPSEPPVNRDSELSPAAWAAISGLVIAAATLVAGLLDTRLLTQEAASSAFGSSARFVVQQLPPALNYLITAFLHPTSQGTLLSPLVFAGWSAFLISFANIIPTKQLEGWRMSSGVLGRRALTVAAFLSLFVIVLVSFWMALFVLAVSWGAREIQPLDGVSPVSKRKPYLYIAMLALAAMVYLLFLYPQLPVFPTFY